jgi:hypothetical protein
MSVPDGFAMPSGQPHDDSPGRNLYNEEARHRARVFEALRRHSDPTLREMGRLLASGALAPHDLLKDPQYADTLRRRTAVLAAMDTDDLHRRIFGVTPSGKPFDRRSRSGPEDHDGGVPAVRR